MIPAKKSRDYFADTLQQTSLALCCAAGWSATIEVEAAVVVIRNAAGADDQGLINPILKRYLGGACSLNVSRRRTQDSA